MPHTHETQGLVLVSLVPPAAKIVGVRWLIRRTGKDGKAENMVEANQSGFEDWWDVGRGLPQNTESVFLLLQEMHCMVSLIDKDQDQNRYLLWHRSAVS